MRLADCGFRVIFYALVAFIAAKEVVGSGDLLRQEHLESPNRRRASSTPGLPAVFVFLVPISFCFCLTCVVPKQETKMRLFS